MVTHERKTGRLPSINEVEELLREAGIPEVPEGGSLPGGLSFKIKRTEPGCLRLLYMHHGLQKRVNFSIDEEGRLEYAAYMTRELAPGDAP